MKLIFEKNILKNTSQKPFKLIVLLIVSLVVLPVVSLVFSGCDSTTSTNKSSAKELTKLVLTYKEKQHVQVITKAIKLNVQGSLDSTPARLKIEVSPKATYTITSANTNTILNNTAGSETLDLTKISLITIVVIAEDGSKNTYTLTITNTLNVPFSKKNELTELVFTYNGESYPVDLSAKTISFPATRFFGGTHFSSGLGISLDKISVSSKATTSIKIGESVDASLSSVTIKVIAQDGTPKEYTFDIIPTIVDVSRFSISDTYTTPRGAQTVFVLGQGVMDDFMEGTTIIIKISNVAAVTDFDVGFKDNVGNILFDGIKIKSNTSGKIVICKRDFTVDGINKIKALITGTNLETRLVLELSPTAMPGDTQTRSISYSPYRIFTWHDLQAMRVDLGGDYVLQRNIYFPAKGARGVFAKGFESIGRDTNKSTKTFEGTAFSGSFDGQGHTISNFSINRLTERFVGLFGSINISDTNKKIKNFTISHTGISGLGHVGAIAGKLTKGSIINVGVTSFNNKIYSGTGSRIGGLVGENAGTVEGYVAGDVEGNSSVGGLVGYNSGTIKGYIMGVVSGNGSVGGLVGYNSGTVKGYIAGAMKGTQNIGGLVGLSSSTGKTVGYSRIIITRPLNVPFLTFGFIIGAASGIAGVGSVKANYSQKESSFSGIDTSVTPVTGTNGTAITVNANTKEANFAFSGDTDWTFTDGKWPAINIGIVRPAANQPIHPFIP